MAVSSRSRIRSRWFLWLTLLAIALTISVGVAIYTSVDVQGLGELQSDLQNARPVLVAIRLTGIAGLYLAWPTLLVFAERRGAISADTQKQLLRSRARYTLWLIALELLLGLDILNHFFSFVLWILS